MALRALGKSFSANNSNILDSDSPSFIPTINLKGMNERTVRSHMIRWRLSPDEYLSIVHGVMSNFAEHGTEMKNPESIIFGACRRFANKRDAEKSRNVQTTETPAAEMPQSSDDESVFDLQERLG